MTPERIFQKGRRAERTGKWLKDAEGERESEGECGEVRDGGGIN